MLEESKERTITMESHDQHFTFTCVQKKAQRGSEHQLTISFGSVKEIAILILVKMVRKTLFETISVGILL